MRDGLRPGGGALSDVRQAPLSLVRGLEVVPDARPAAGLPLPPTDAERDRYSGPQWRWVPVASFTSWVLVVVSVAFFLLRHLAALPLALALALSGVGTCVSLFTSSRRRRWSLEEHRTTVAAWEPDYLPSVDVFLPSAGEPLEVLANTYRHVRAIAWPGELVVHVLDDSGRPEVAALAAASGFRYSSRPDRGRLKKAGNLRHGFEHSQGDLILVLDADFVPRPDVLFHLVPYFDDERVGIVQSPQYFDVTRAMNWLQRSAGATQVLFYRWVQPSRDRSDAAICVGTSAVYRRSALERAGGFAQIGHSEDVHTGVNVTRAGSVVRYVPVVVTKGLCPDTLDQFLTQQYRWCTGSMSLLFSRSFHRTRLTLAQRLCYWSGFLYYITTAVNVLAMALPTLLMGVFWPGQVRAQNYVFVAAALAARQAVVPFITLERASLLELARVQTAYSFCHAVALADVLRGRSDSWSPTGATSQSRTAVRVRRLMRWWLGGVQVLLWAVVAVRVPRYGIGPYALLIALALVNLWVVAPLLLGRTDLRLPLRSKEDSAPGPLERRAGQAQGPRRRGGMRLAVLHLGVVALLQTVLAYRPGTNSRPFIDEGLYVYMGHRMVEHVLHGSFLREYPGSFFSGAPGLYPVLAAMGDSVAGLEGARAVSLIGAIGAMVGCYGLARTLFGSVAGLLAAVGFACSGSVIYQSHLAVYDSWMMMFVALAAWLTAWSARRDGLAAAPVVGLLLTLAFFTKYAGAAYVPVVAALGVAVGRQRWGRVVVRRAVTVVVCFLVATSFVLVLWGSSLWAGIERTTLERSVLIPTTRAHLLDQAVTWVGPWLALALLGGLWRVRRSPGLVVVLLVGAVIGPLQQMRIEESTSFNKHLAFGLVFACPLLGDAGARLLRARARWARVVAVPLTTAVLVGLGAHGLHFSQRWLTGWVQDDTLLAPLRSALALNPDKVVLAEEGAPERYELRREGLLTPADYADTYQLRYEGETGEAAYQRAIDETHFGVISLTLNTANGRWIHDYLRTHHTPYTLYAEPMRVLRGVKVGSWLVYVPRVSVPQG